MPAATPRKTTHGFTLIELLVVIALIVIIVAILFPVFGRVRRHSHKAVCMSNLKQIYQAAKMYCEDHDRRLVPARVWTPGGPTLGITWCILLQPYMKNEEILTCPLDSEPQTAKNSTDLPHSYGINYDLTFITGLGAANLTRCMSNLNRTSDLILFFDMKPEAQAMGASWTAHRLSRVAFRHHEQANFAFLDGHVKSYPLGQVDNMTMWNP